MAGILFVVCVPTKDQESRILNLVPHNPKSGLKATTSDGDLLVLKSRENLDAPPPPPPPPPLHTRSRSEESVRSSCTERSQQQQSFNGSKRELYIGPWRVDASDLPSSNRKPPAPAAARAPRHRVRQGQEHAVEEVDVDSSHGLAMSLSSDTLGFPAGSIADCLAGEGDGTGAGAGDARRRVSMSKSDPEGLARQGQGNGPAAPAPGSARKRGSSVKSNRSCADPTDRDDNGHVFMEKLLEDVLKKLKINNAVWCVGRSGRYYQVIFSVESGDPCEFALQKLAERGIGVKLDSVVSVIPCALYYQGSEQSSTGSAEDLDDFLYDGPEKGECLGQAVGPGPGQRQRGELGAWERFVQSVRSRLTVAQVVEGVRAKSTFTFDFLVLLIVAAFVATLGLLENNTVILVASMLISPLMGPVMAATFGTMIHDRALQKMGLVNEFAGLMLCLCIGFLSGLAIGFLDGPWASRDMVESQCLVSLMCRGQLRSLWVNVLIALLSGAGIAISLLRDNTGSLVGVAISASLLPPAVNAGLLWAMSVVHVVTGSDTSQTFSSFYSDSPAVEMAVMGGISLCLTIINIVFIYSTGIIMLKLKEVAPHSEAHQHFWRHDVKIARDYNATMYGASAAEMLRNAVQHEQGAGECDPDAPTVKPQLQQLLKLSAKMNDDRLRVICEHHQLTWSPSTMCSPVLAGVGARAAGVRGVGVGESVRESVRELESLYHTLRVRQHRHQHRTFYRRSSEHGGPGPVWRLGSSGGYVPLRPTSPAIVEEAAMPEVRVTQPVDQQVKSTSQRQAKRTPEAVDVDPRPPRRLAGLALWHTPSASDTEYGEASVEGPVVGAGETSGMLTPTTYSDFTPLSAFFTPRVGENESTPLREHLPVQSGAGGAVGAAEKRGAGAAVDGSLTQDCHHQRPVKKRRFLVTKADESDLLLPQQNA